MSGMASRAVPSPPGRRRAVRLAIAACMAIVLVLGVSAVIIEFGHEAGLELVSDDLVAPTSIVEDPHGRLLIVQQGGEIVMVDGGTASTFVDLSDAVLNQGERGLLGIALHPAYAANGRVFVMYSDVDGDSVVSELASAGDHLERESERVMLQIPQGTVYHKGGSLQFGPDGYLYIGVGDDDRFEDEYGAPPRMDLVGTILRVDVDGRDAGLEYAIPSGNAFTRGEGPPEVWDYGLRNPWRFSFDPATGDLWIGDVGWNNAEEINLHPADAPAGLDFGWRASEGFECRGGRSCDLSGVTLPVAVHRHDAENLCALIGGYVYRGSQAPRMQGQYIYGDLCSREIRALDPETGVSRLIRSTDLSITTFGVDSAGELYVAGLNGLVYRLSFRR